MANTQKAEANNEKFEFEFNGEKYEVYTEDLSDLEVLEYFSAGNVPQGLIVLIGQEDYDRFKDTNRNARGRIPADVAGKFLEALYEAAGLGN